MIKPIIVYGQDLRRVSQPVSEFSTEALRTLLQDMRETMLAANGQGLAAVQIGVLQRVIIVEFTERKQTPMGEQTVTEKWAMCNPVIEDFEGEQVVNEGCLSLPGLRVGVKRPAEIAVRFQDENGEFHRIVATDKLASCIAHEIDHCDGTTIVERVGGVMRDLIKRRFARAARNQFRGVPYHVVARAAAV